MTPKYARGTAFLLLLTVLLPLLAGCGKGQNVSPASIAQSGKDKRQKPGQ